MSAGSAVAAFGAFVLVVLWLGLIFNLGRERDFAVNMANADTANLARAFEEHINRTMMGLDQTLLLLKAEYEQDPAHFTLRKSVSLSTMLRNNRLSLTLADVNGSLIESSQDDTPRINVSDREYFRFQKAATDDQLFIGPPIVGRLSGRWIIMLTRRLVNADGSFAGTISLSLDPLYLSGFYNSINLGDNGAVLLIGRDGLVRAGSDVPVGHAPAVTALADRIFAEGAGTMEIQGPLDNEVRISSFRVLKGMPLAVWVGRSKNEVLAQPRMRQNLYVLAGCGITVLLMGALVLVFRIVRRQEEIAYDLAIKKAELTASRERLRRYVSDLERIAEVAAHDLQEPLRRVVAYTQLLSTHSQLNDDAEGREYVSHVVAGAQHMRKLVKDLEAFVAVDNLPFPVSTVPANVSVSAASDRLADAVRDAQASLLVDPLPQVAIDEKSLTEIFAQLLDNALRYRSPERRLLIHVTAWVDGGQAVFSVHDNGVGIDERHMARAFEIFHRLPGLDGHRGTGMGLAIVRRMVERHGGRVWVESQPDAGSTFFFSLPINVADGAQTQEVQAA